MSRDVAADHDASSPFDAPTLPSPGKRALTDRMSRRSAMPASTGAAAPRWEDPTLSDASYLDTLLAVSSTGTAPAAATSRGAVDPAARAEAEATLYAALAALEHKPGELFVASRYQAAMANFESALRGRVGTHVLTATERADVFADAVHGLAPAFDAVWRDNASLVQSVKSKLRPLRERFELAKADHRVDERSHAERSELGEHVMDVESQRASMQSTVKLVLDAAGKALKGAGALESTARVGLGETEHVLGVALALLKFSDHEFRDKARAVLSGPFASVKDTAEVLKVTTDLVKGSINLLAKAGIAAANARGMADLASKFATAAKVGKAIGALGNAADVVYGGFLLLSDNSSVGERAEGAFKIASGGAQLAGYIAGSTVLTAGGAAVGATFALYKLFLSEFGPAASGLNYGLWRQAGATLVRQGNRILAATAGVAAAADLAEAEQDPAQKHALMKLALAATPPLTKAVNATLTDVEDGSHYGIDDPGGYLFVKREFEPLRGLRCDDQTLPAEAVHAAMKIIETIVTLFRNSDQLLMEGRGRLMPLDVAKRRQAATAATATHRAGHYNRATTHQEDLQEAASGY